MSDKLDYGPRGFCAYMQAQVQEMNSGFNRWVTGEKVNHDPSELELYSNYVSSGGAARFRAKWFAVIAEIRSSFNRWVTGEKVGHDPSDSELYQHFAASGAEARLTKELDRVYL